MGGKRRAQPSGDAQGKSAASEDAAAAQGGALQQRQLQGLSVDGAADGSAEAGSCGQEDSGSILAPVTMCLSMRCNPSALAGRKAALEAALEAALKKVATDFGGRECRVEWTRVGPSEDTLQRVLPLLLERVGAEGAVHCFLAQCFHVCKSWRRELEAWSFCNTTVQLCSALAGGGDADRLQQNALRRLTASTDVDAERALCLDCGAFLEKSLGWKGSLQEWLQAASQEPDASFLSRGAASTAQRLGLVLVRWVGKPQGRYPGSYTLKGHSECVVSVALSRDGLRAASASEDKLVKIWNTETGDEVCTIGHTCTGSCICSKSDRNPDCPVSGHSREVNSVDFSPDGQQFVSGSSDTFVKIWDVATGALDYPLRYKGGGRQMRTLTARSFAARPVAFSRDGNRIVSGSWDHLVKIWNAETGALIRTLTGHSGIVFSVALSRDGNRVVSGSEDLLVKIWDTVTGGEIWSSEGHDCTGRCICTEDEEEELVRNPECPVTGHSDTVGQVAFSHDGAQVVSASRDNTVRWWDVASGRQVRQFAGVVFALVEGLSGEYKRDCHVITASGDTLRIYKIGREQQHAEGGAAAAPVACFKAPQLINSVRCHGATICVGCDGGAVCFLSAPFLAA